MRKFGVFFFPRSNALPRLFSNSFLLTLLLRLLLRQNPLRNFFFALSYIYLLRDIDRYICLERIEKTFKFVAVLEKRMREREREREIKNRGKFKKVRSPLLRMDSESTFGKAVSSGWRFARAVYYAKKCTQD